MITVLIKIFHPAIAKLLRVFKLRRGVCLARVPHQPGPNSSGYYSGYWLLHSVVSNGFNLSNSDISRHD